MCMAIISISVGLGVMIYDGLITSLPQFRAFWLVLGGVAFYLPGVAYLLSWWGLGRGRYMAALAGLPMAAVQAALALFAAVGHAAGGLPFVWTVFAGGFLWAVVCVVLVFQIRRALPWVAADAETHHGFEITTNGPREV